VTWDETRAMDAAIGDFAAVARRRGNDWFIGAITDESARKLNLPLSFLDPDQTYEATLYTDGKDADWEKNPTPVEITTKTVRAGESLNLSLASSGGAAIRLRPVRAEASPAPGDATGE